jgi:hypothetical protein
MQPTIDTRNLFQLVKRHRWWTAIAAVMLVLIVGWTSAAHAGYSYRKRITIDHTRVGTGCSHLYDFPVFIKIANDPELKTTANGGHVFSNKGHDIVFKDDGGSKLDHEVLQYNGSTGSLEAFVRLPQVSSLTDTIFYIHYGDTSVSGSQENATGVWSNGFTMVYHLDEASGTSGTGSVKDSTGNTSGTPSSGLKFGSWGKVGDSADFSASTGINCGTVGAGLVSEDTTISFWIRSYDVDNPSRQNPFNHAYGGWGTFTLETNGKINWFMGSAGGNASPYTAYGSGSGSVTDNAWIYMVGVRNSAGDKWTWYKNGNVRTSGTYDSSYPEIRDRTFTIGDGYVRPINGRMDEFRVSSTPREGCWIKTEYNNQNSPGTFYSVGAEEGASALHTINATAGIGGVISPVGDVIVDAGNDQIFTITAATGYQISDVLVDGGSVGTPSSYPFPNVTDDHTIRAIFAEIDTGGGDDDGDGPMLNGCGVVDVSTDYNDGFTAGTLNMINTHVEDGTGHLVLKTGFAAIDKEHIVIPFDQEVFVNALYIAGRNDLGYALYEDMVDGSGNFIGFENVPVAKRQGLFRGTWDGAYSGGDGVFDESYAYGNFPDWSEAGIAAYDDGTGRPFLVNNDGTPSARDMRKSLGVIAGGTEIVMYILQVDRAGMHYDDPDFGNGNSKDHIFFNKREWNPDYWPGWHPDPECNPGFSPWDKIYQLDGPADEGTCHNPGGWLQLTSHDRLLSEFNLVMSNASHATVIEDGKPYDHAIVGAPVDDPNQWILGFEQNNIQYITGSDIDCNDVVFKLERKTGGMAELASEHAISSGSADTSFTGVTLEVWDYMPCVDDNEINYELSIDDGANWVQVSGWDEIYVSNTNKDILSKIENSDWQPGSPAYTYRTIRVDFAGLGLTGHEIRWRAQLISTNEACEPRILDLAIRATVMQDAEVSRAGPVVKANVLYSGSYAIVDSGGQEQLHGHLRATRIYDPNNMEAGTTGELIWDAGVQLNDENPSTRKILIPHVAVTTVTNEVVATGLGPGENESENKYFTGTLAHAPIVAESLKITDMQESFTDKHTDVLEGNLGGKGKIDRFSGEFSVEFNTAPVIDAPITASYKYYAAYSNLLDFNSTNVSTEMLGIDDTFVVGKGYTYDFDGDGTYEAGDDRQWLINWVRGYKDGASTKKDWLLGAIDHSMQALQTPPSRPDWYYGTAISRAERKTYKAFIEANKSRRTVLYNGARDGMLHAFDAGQYVHPDPDNPDLCPNKGENDENDRGCFLDEDYGTGEELWAFIPANLIPRLKNNVLQGDDQAYVDGSPALADVYTDGQWRTVLLSAQGNGGDTIFCLDVTNPLDPKFLWEFADPDLFRSRSSP